MEIFSRNSQADFDELVLMHDVLKIFTTEAYCSNDNFENEIAKILYQGIDQLQVKINDLILKGRDSDFIRTNDCKINKETRAAILKVFTRMKFKEGFDELGLPL